jgi:hypothetical protein
MNAGKIWAIIGAFIVLGVILGTVANAQGMPHAVFGYVKDDAGNAVANATVTLRNDRTGDVISTDANELGQYQTDLSSMASGYQIGDTITVKAVSGDDIEGTATLTVTTSALDQCDVTVSEVKSDDTPFPSVLVIVVLVSFLSIGVASIINRCR